MLLYSACPTGKEGRSGEEMARARRVSGRDTLTSGSNEKPTEEDPEGLEKLSQQADKTLGETSDKIAGALGKNAGEGDVACAKLLVELAKRKKRKKWSAAQEKSIESTASRLANEPEWPGPEASADKNAGHCAKKR